MYVRKVNPIDIDMNWRKISSKWKPIILLVLRPKPARFNKLKQLTVGISSNMLTSSLKELEEDNLIINDGGNYMLTENAEVVVDLMLQILKVMDTL